MAPEWPYQTGTEFDGVTGGPLARTGARLSRNRVLGFQVGVPRGPSWHPVTEIAESAWLLDAWLAELTERSCGKRNVAAASLANRFASRIVKPAFAAYLTERRVPAAAPGEIVLHWDPRERFTGTAFTTPRVTALADDPEAAHPDAAVLAGRAELTDALAGFIVEAVTPVFRAIRARAPLGGPALWGSAVDAVANGSMLTTRLFGLRGRETWGHVEAVVDRLAVRVSQVKARPRLFPVRWSGGEVFFVVRGTCCLKYQEFRARGGVPDRRGGAGFCATCPLRDDGGRAAERRAKLERMAR
jgi:hypothetical protein